MDRLDPDLTEALARGREPRSRTRSPSACGSSSRMPKSTGRDRTCGGSTIAKPTRRRAVNGAERTLSFSPRHIVGFSSRQTTDRWQSTVVLIYVSGQVAPLEIRETSVMTAIEKWRTAMALDVAYETAPVVALLRQVRDEVCGLRKTKRTEAGPNEAV